MSKQRIGSRLSGAEFTRGMLADLEKAEVLAQFGGQGLVTDVLGVVGDGKEATVYLCAAHESVGVEWLAAKVYRAAKFRAFRGGRSYAGERTALSSRAKRAMRTKTDTGKRIAHHEWVAWEWETLCRLHDAGADVPEPLASSDDAILMEFVGDGEGAAPQLRFVDLEPDAARAALERLLHNVEILLDSHLVHGDLSAYNVLWWQEKPWIIDVPQSLNLHTHQGGFEFLRRDIANLERYFARYGLSARDFADRAWRRYLRGELGG
ncbi:MAG: RIO1 family regulatory kinase/ATPase [Myxococcota bacterium]